MKSLHLPPHSLKIALIHPQIPPNTGQIARLCVASGAELHLVRPMGFVLSDRQLKRAAMDYWARLKLAVHDDIESFLNAVGQERIWLFENQGGRSIWDVKFQKTDWLIFGSENHGLPKPLIERYPDQLLRVPQVQGERCLNLSSAVALGLYEALRQVSDR
jgi:tRNA (cytidine/uridine-2'-O-)-methyltransferase